MQKSHGDLHSATASGFGLQGDDVVIHEDGTVGRSPGLSARSGADDDASTRGVHSPQDSGLSEGQFGMSGSIPIIKVSTESDIERELAAAANGETVGDATGKENGHEDGVTSPTLERPVVAAAAATDQETVETPRTPQDAFSFTNKRLCERWLDNLFMVLYEVRRFTLGRHAGTDRVTGPTRLDHLSSRSRAFQNAARGVPQDGVGMGDLGRFGAEVASQGRSQGGVSAMSRDGAVCAKAVGQVVGDVCRRRGHHADDSDCDPGGCVSVCGLYRDDGALCFGCGVG